MCIKVFFHYYVLMPDFVAEIRNVGVFGSSLTDIMMTFCVSASFIDKYYGSVFFFYFNYKKKIFELF